MKPSVVELTAIALGLVALFVFLTRPAVAPTKATTSAPPAATATATPARTITQAKTVSASSTSTPTAPKTPTATSATPAAAPVSIDATTTPAPTAAQVSAALTRSAARLRAALVNIICITNSTGALRSISGSGVIIDPRGIILTNSHIAQYFLLRNYPSSGGTQCIVRTGSPARDAYTASLMFVSPAWIAENATDLTQYAPIGTGEHDLALLAITGSATSDPLPSTFPYVPLAVRAPALNEPVVIGSYGAQFLTTTQVESSLYPTLVYGTVHKRYTFATSTVDVVSLGGTAAAQEGSSGGGVLDAAGELVGTITTSTTQGATQTRDLHAITASYVRRDYDEETGMTFDTMLAQAPSAVVAAFAPYIAALSATLVHALSVTP